MAVQTITGRSVDARVYEEELNPWLPSRIIDFHIHLFLPEHRRPISAARRAERWPLEVAQQHSYDDMLSNFRLLFPRQEVSALIFGHVCRETYLEQNNAYIRDVAARGEGVAGTLFTTRPEWEPERIEQAIADGFVGIKPYPDQAPEGRSPVGVFDFIPRNQLSVLNRLGGILVLHLPRVGRLADPDNIREVLAISDDYPDIKLVVAHVGRAYCLPTAQRGLHHFADRKSIYFDISANLNADVLELALDTVGPDRLLYGSDLPIMMMRGKREYDGEKYINFTDGPYSWNINRKSPEEEADYTYYIYEEIRALIDAVQRVGLGEQAIEKIMYGNAARLLARVSAGRQ